MPLTGDFAGLRRMNRTIAGLVEPDSPIFKRIVAAAEVAVKDLVRAEFIHGVDPDGNPFQPKKNGKPALISDRLARAFETDARGSHVLLSGKSFSASQILAGHQFGHLFPQRSVAAGVSHFDANGRTLSGRQFAKAIGKKYLGIGEGRFARSRRGPNGKYFEIVARSVRVGAHHVGPRKLPQRPSYPTGSDLTPRWSSGIGAGVAAAIVSSLEGVKR